MLPSVASLLTATALHARVRIFLDPPYPPSLSTLPLSPQYFIYLPLHHALLRFSSTVHSAQTVQSYSTVITFIKISKLLLYILDMACTASRLFVAFIIPSVRFSEIFQSALPISISNCSISDSIVYLICMNPNTTDVSNYVSINGTIIFFTN